MPWLPGYLLQFNGLLVTGLSGNILVTGSLRGKGRLRCDCFTGPEFHFRVVAGCELLPGGWMSGWLTG